MTSRGFEANAVETARHRTTWIEAGPKQGPLMIFLHGWPELGLVWRHHTTVTPSSFKYGIFSTSPA